MNLKDMVSQVKIHSSGTTESLVTVITERDVASGVGGPITAERSRGPRTTGLGERRRKIKPGCPGVLRNGSGAQTGPQRMGPGKRFIHEPAVLAPTHELGMLRNPLGILSLETS